MKFPTDATLWPKGPVRRASQNSFGFGGASAHLVIDDAYNYLRLRGLEGRHRTVRDPSSARPHEIPTITSSIHGVPQGKDRQPRLLVWSAPEETALERVLSVHKEHYRNLQPSLQDAGYLADLSYTLNTKRDLGLWRAYGIAASIEDLAGPMWADISKPIRSASDVRVGFVFTGQGAQWPCMGVELMIFKTFARSLSEAEALFSRLGSTWRLIGKLVNEPLMRLMLNTEQRKCQSQKGTPVCQILPFRNQRVQHCRLLSLTCSVIGMFSRQQW